MVTFEESMRIIILRLYMCLLIFVIGILISIIIMELVEGLNGNQDLELGCLILVNLLIHHILAVVEIVLCICSLVNVVTFCELN